MRILWIQVLPLVVYERSLTLMNIKLTPSKYFFWLKTGVMEISKYLVPFEAIHSTFFKVTLVKLVA